MNAPSLSLPSFAVDQVLVGRVAKNRGELARVADTSADGRLLLQYANGKRRWSTLATALASYRLATDGDDTKAVQWLYNGPPPAVPEGNQFTDFAAPRPGLAKGKPLAANDESVAPELIPVVNMVAEVVTPGPVVESPVEVVPSSTPGPEVETGTVVPEGMALVTRDGLSLAIPQSGEGQAKVQDSTLAEFIGLDDPRSFRRRVKECETAGDLGSVDWRAQDAWQSTGNGGSRKFKVTVAWLDQAQALYMIAKSNTPKANEMTRRVIAVFLDVQSGKAPPAPAFDVQGLVASVVGETMKALVPFLANLNRSVIEPDPKATEALREVEEKKANAKRRAEETRKFKDAYPELREVFFPRLSEFVLTRLDRLDMQQPAHRERCLRSFEVKDLFLAWLRERKATRFPDQRAVFAMLKELSDGVRIAGKGDKEVFLPWGLKTAQTALSLGDRGNK